MREPAAKHLFLALLVALPHCVLSSALWRSSIPGSSRKKQVGIFLINGEEAVRAACNRVRSL